MATDINLIIKNLLEFYDFRDKVVISVGAGGGQMIEYARPAKKVIAIDNDEGAITKLKENLKQSDLGNKFKVIRSNFFDADVKGDVVLFEICLHEMSDPVLALKKAGTMAPDTVIFDHLPGKWSFYTAETEKIERGWKAIRAAAPRKEAEFNAVQIFKNHDEIYENPSSSSASIFLSIWVIILMMESVLGLFTFDGLSTLLLAGPGLFASLRISFI